MFYDKDDCKDIIAMPKEIILYNGCTNDPCDMLSGPCACGGWHNVRDIRELCKDKGIYCEELEQVINKAVLKYNATEALDVMLRGM